MDPIFPKARQCSLKGAWPLAYVLQGNSLDQGTPVNRAARGNRRSAFLLVFTLNSFVFCFFMGRYRSMEREQRPSQLGVTFVGNRHGG